MRKGCRVWGNAERLPQEGFVRIAGQLPFEVVEYANGTLNLEHAAFHVDEDEVRDAAQAIAGVLSENGFGQLDLIDHNQDFVLRLAIASDGVRERRTSTDDVLDKYR